MNNINEIESNEENKLSEFENEEPPKSKSKKIYKIIMGLILIYAGWSLHNFGYLGIAMVLWGAFRIFSALKE